MYCVFLVEGSKNKYHIIKLDVIASLVNFNMCFVFEFHSHSIFFAVSSPIQVCFLLIVSFRLVSNFSCRLFVHSELRTIFRLLVTVSGYVFTNMRLTIDGLFVRKMVDTLFSICNRFYSSRTIEFVTQFPSLLYGP